MNPAVNPFESFHATTTYWFQAATATSAWVSAAGGPASPVGSLARTLAESACKLTCTRAGSFANPCQRSGSRRGPM